jgi:hypothetical protein
MWALCTRNDFWGFAQHLCHDASKKLCAALQVILLIRRRLKINELLHMSKHLCRSSIERRAQLGIRWCPGWQWHASILPDNMD